MTDSNEVNVPLLRKAVEWVEAQAQLPEIDREWDQASWVAPPKTRAQDMLWDIADAGAPLNASGIRSTAEVLANYCGTAYCVAGYVGQLLDEDYKKTYAPEGKPFVSEFAKDALGIDSENANVLFDCENSAEDIRMIAEHIAGEKL